LVWPETMFEAAVLRAAAVSVVEVVENEMTFEERRDTNVEVVVKPARSVHVFECEPMPWP